MIQHHHEKTKYINSVCYKVQFPKTVLSKPSSQKIKKINKGSLKEKMNPTSLLLSESFPVPVSCV